MNELEDTLLLNQNRLHFASKSILGERRSQQDAIGVVARDEETTLSIVADGMGGLSGGELASMVTLNTFSGHFMNDPIDSVPRFLYELADECDQTIYTLRDEQGKLLKAGTTLVAAYVHQDQLYYISVGDSRLYLYRNHQLIQLTKDHNYAMLLEEAKGKMSREAYQNEIKKGEFLVSYLGMGGLKYLELTKEPIVLQPQDYLLLCSDGLYKRLSDDKIAAILRDAPFLSIARCVDLLLEEATEAYNGRRQDNTSVILEGYY